MPQIKVEVKGIDKLPPKLNSETLVGTFSSDLLQKSAVYTQRQAMRYTPVDRGRARAGWQTEYGGGAIPMYADVINMVEYIENVEYGTKPHDIYPKNKKALAFQAGGKLGRGKRRRGRGGAMIGGGAMVIVKHVHHPGTKAVHMAQKAADDIRARLPVMVKAAAMEMKKRFQS